MGVVRQRILPPKAQGIITENDLSRYLETTMLVLYTVVKDGLSLKSNLAWTQLRDITEIGREGTTNFCDAYFEKKAITF